jgi:hypothetical protein
MHFDGLEFSRAVQLLTGEAEKRPQVRLSSPQLEDDDTVRIKAALHVWRQADELRGIAKTYLRRDRQLDYIEDLSHCLRWHERLGALIALFRDIRTDEPLAVSRIFLDAEGHLKERLFLGPVKGCAVKIDPDENVTMGLHICEGIESAIAARELGLSPVWAAGSVGAVAKFPVLGGIECLTILAEEKDRKETQECFERWRDAGREVIVLHSKNGGDANDALRTIKGISP